LAQGLPLQTDSPLASFTQKQAAHQVVCSLDMPLFLTEFGAAVNRKTAKKMEGEATQNTRGSGCKTACLPEGWVSL